MKIYIYAQHTLFGGEIVPQYKIDDYTDPDNPHLGADDCDDWVVYEGTAEELKKLANDILAVPAHGSNEVFRHKEANNILAAIENI